VTVAKSAFYVFAKKLNCAGLQPDFSRIKNIQQVNDYNFKKQRLPEDFRFDGPLLLGSPKPPDKSYDICGSDMVSENLANVLREVVGDGMRLFPYDVQHNPKAKYPLTGKYYYLDIPYVDCLRYEYGPEEPTWEWARKGYEIYGKPFPATCRPVIDITIDVEATAGLQLFRPVDMLSGAMMTHKLWKACKAAKVVGMVNMTAEYYFYIKQCVINNDMGSAYGTHLAQKNP
jgi:hypothetical protein